MITVLISFMITLIILIVGVGILKQCKDDKELKGIAPVIGYLFAIFGVNTLLLIIKWLWTL